jgi:hypothetical protein
MMCSELKMILTAFTRTLLALLILSAGVKLGVKGSVHLGAVRLFRPDCS